MKTLFTKTDAKLYFFMQTHVPNTKKIVNL